MPHRPHVGEIDGGHVARDDGGHGRVPGEARADERDVDAIAGGAEQVPAAAERDRTAAGRCIAPAPAGTPGSARRDSRWRSGTSVRAKRARHLERAGAARRHPAHDGADAEKAPRNSSQNATRPTLLIGMAPCSPRPGKRVRRALFEQRPFAGADQPVVEHGREQQQHEGHHRRRDGPAVEQAARRTGAAAAGRPVASVGAKRAKVPNTSENTSPCRSQASRPKASMPAQVSSE